MTKTIKRLPKLISITISACTSCVQYIRPIHQTTHRPAKRKHVEKLFAGRAETTNSYVNKARAFSQLLPAFTAESGINDNRRTTSLASPLSPLQTQKLAQIGYVELR
ncbi:MAG: hypothetical protein N3A57_03280 [Negativicutes bacterium]|nr:hypothetical protein [Negativicutes bacterium]